MDWSEGDYERIARQLLPAARAVIDETAVRPGERVVDVGCGTGNGALLAAERGAVVTGIDPAQRLLDVAGAEVAARGLRATFVRGDAAALPLGPAVADAVVSIFGVMFAPDPGAAAAEIARVTAPQGRVLLSAWIPSGALFEVTRLRRAALAAAGEPPSGNPPFGWHDAEALAEVFLGLGFSVELKEMSLPFTAPSPRAFLDSELRDHPMWVGARALLESQNRLAEVRERALEIFESANEEPSAFRVTSRYVIAMLRRD